MFETLPEELLHQIIAMCHSIDYDVFADRSPEPLLAHRNEMARLLLVCHRWRRVATLLKYETVIVTSQAEASILASILSRGGVGSYVKRLRIEGEFGQALRTILSKVPRLVALSVSLDITSESKGAGPCAGARTQRSRALARALVHIPKLQIVYVPRAYYISEDDVVLNAIKNASVQRIYSWIPWQDGFIIPPLDRYSRLRDTIYLPLPGPWLRPTYAAIGQGWPGDLFPTTFTFCTQSHVYRRLWSDRL
ncbi:uncharacterized protein LACBIDRAFT_307455 [Laccaria bicolor S238N-H82]|uniref:Predicted protein n=1 Tax=Laccaria bicolor (strain S238N-H82 / ATCC MYA-4686) TaxID=486041 RepID=B0DQ67_LACBS|nr:uncharacterized protein LACBIDRAFT_307455 [Laccaria bicolor S238N-H82]EDR03240.1 predicted protein [Laccaria bicolor S238N-H82]|eukprot:XP_001886036.1 predicted protein [Laccaria bicolor S238N-H82]